MKPFDMHDHGNDMYGWLAVDNDIPYLIGLVNKVHLHQIIPDHGNCEEVTLHLNDKLLLFGN
jgi:bisphosphoglycerate-independent phosphoglycerate mutase (AlkP superfamily)